MAQSEYIAALDLGSSKIIGMIGKKSPNGEIDIIACEKEDSNNCIQRAYVHNVEETASKIRSVISKLNRHLDREIDKVYVGIGGQSLSTKTYSVFKDVNGSIVDRNLIRSLYSECDYYEPEDAIVLDKVSPEFFLDGRQELKPEGIPCNKIEARFKLILGKKRLRQNLYKSVSEKAGVNIAESFIIAPLATAEAVLTVHDKELGCALVEVGAGVTYVSVFKGGDLKYLVTIPLGGNVITKDICHLNFLEKEAEELKTELGSAVELDSDEKLDMANVAESLFGQRDINLDELNDVIEARAEEIVANINEQIKLSGFSSSLSSGILLTGGCAALKKFSELLQIKTKNKVRIAFPDRLLSRESSDYGNVLGNAEIIGLLSLGKINCAKKDPVYNDTLFANDFSDKTEKKEKASTDQKIKREKVKKQKGPGLFGKLTQKIDSFSKNLFEDEEKEEKEENKEK